MRRKVDPRHDLLSSAFPKGDVLCDRSRHSAREFRFVVEQRIITRGDDGINPTFQESHLA